MLEIVRKNGVFAVMTLAGVMWAGLPVLGQEQEEEVARADESAVERDGANAEGATGEEIAVAPDKVKTIRFAFDGATLDQVLEFFSRETGLPVVREADVNGKATFTYRAPEAYTMQEALRVLNILLQTRGVMLRVNNDMLYLQKLENMIAEEVPTFRGEVPETVTDDQIVVAVIPLDNTPALAIAESIKSMVASYGSVTAMTTQNSVVICETAGKIRQLRELISELDKRDFEGVVEIFRIRHAKAAELMNPLKALLAERVERIIINQKGQQTKVSDNEIKGLTISHDDRTNSIIAKGSQSKVEELKDAINLLDVPDASSERAMRTFSLAVLAPNDAVQKLNQLYTKLPNDERPTIMPLEQEAKVTVIGSASTILEAEKLLAEIDGGSQDGDASSDDDRTVTVIPLEHVDANAVQTAIRGLLNQRQLAQSRLIPGRDGASIIVSAEARDLRSITSMVKMLDQPIRVDKQVRLVSLTTPKPQESLTKAQTLYAEQVDETDATMAITVTYDPESRTATLIGSSRALDTFAQTLRMVETNAVVDRERREYTLTSESPSKIIRPLSTMTRQMLDLGAAPYVEPTFEPIDELDMLIVSAQPEQFSVIESLVQTLDKKDPSDFQFKTIPLESISDVDALLTRTDDIYHRMTVGYEEGQMPRPEVEFDTLTGNLMVTGSNESIALYERALGEARRLLPPAREGRMIPLEFVDASEIIEPLNKLIETTKRAGNARQIPAPQISVVDETNSLYVVAEPAQHAVIERYVGELDALEPADLPPLRLLQVRAADAMQIANMLRERYDKRSAEQRREAPVTVDADAPTNTLIVTAPDTLYQEIADFVDSVNESGVDSAERQTRIFPLKRARAVDLASAMEKLYPEPPMPRDRRGNPMPHLQEPREVLVSADPATNSLIVEAPSERMSSFEALVNQLDRVELPPQAELRTYRVERGDMDQIVRTLTNLEDQLVERPEDGSSPVPVTIEAEPQSRTLIVAGDQTTFAKVEQILKDLSVVPVERELRVIEVVRTDPDELAQRALETYQSVTKDDPDATEVQVDVDAENGTLMVVAEPSAMARFVGIVSTLQDSLGPAPDVRMITLDFANATDVVTFLEDLAQNEIVSRTDSTASKPTYFALERLNAVLIAAQPEQHAIISSIVESLDQQQSQDMPPLRILQVRTADAQNLATALMNQYNKRSGDEKRLKPVSITADPNTNALIVAAHPDVLPEIQTIVEDLNSVNQMSSEGREIRIFPLKVARAEDLASTIDEMYPEPEPLYDRRGNPIPGTKQPREVVVRADPQTNSLIVDATVQRMAGFEKLVEQLDRQKIEADTEIRTYRVVHADLASLADSIRQLANSGNLGSPQDRQTQITVTTEPVSQSLVVSGPTEMFSKLEKVLDALDVERPGPETSLRFFRLEHARADSVAEMLREILIARINEELPEAQADAAALLNVTTDRKTNLLILSAPESIMPVAEALIEQLDDPSVSALGDPVVRIRPLTFANASEVTSSLQQALPDLISEETGDPVDIKLIPSSGTNAIVLVGIESDLAQVESLIEGLDRQQSTEAMDATTFSLEFANAKEIAPVLQRLLTNQQNTDPRIIAQRLRSSRGNIDLTPEVQVEATGDNRLIVSGTKQVVELARTIITQLDQPADQGSRIFLTYTPRNGDPQALIDTVERVMSSTRVRSRQTPLELIAEPVSGAVVVVGPEDEANQAVELLSSWDEKALTAPQVDLKIVRLQNSDANVVANAVTPLLRDQTRWPTHLRRLLDRGIAIAQPTVTADTTLNRLLISAPQELLPIATGLISELDQPRDDHSVDIRIFNLKTATASDVASAVSQAMSTRARSNPGETAPTVTAEASSNSVIVTATDRQMTEVEAIVQSLDQGIDLDQPQVRTIFLKHARAEQVAPIVQQLLTSEREIETDRLPNWVMADIVQRKMQQEGPLPIRVAADSRLNAVVVSATPPVLDVAEEMVAQLDVGGDPASGQRAVRVMPIDNADASELAATIEAMFDGPEQVGPTPTIRVESTSNSLIVRGTEEQLASIEAMVNQVDRAAIGASREMRTIMIDPSRAEAAQVAEALRRMLRVRGESRVEVISAEELLRRQRLRSKEAEEEGAPQPEGEPISMRPGQWGTLATMAIFATPPVDDAMQAADSPEGQSSTGDASPADQNEPPASDDQVDDETSTTDMTDTPTSSNAENAENDESAALASDEPTSSQSDAPRNAPADTDEPDRAATQDGAGTNDRSSRTEGDKSVGELQAALDAAADVTIAVDEKTNALIVIGSPRAVDRVRTLAEQVQAQLPAMPGTIRYVGLPESVDAGQAAQLINGTLGQITPMGGRRGELRQRVGVIPDPTNNALIIAANEVDFETVADLIVAISQPSTTEAVVVKVYPLEKITAQRAATSVRDLIGLDAGNQQGRRGRQAERMRRTLDIELRASGQTIEAAFDPTMIEVTSDEHSNSLIVMGPPEAIGFVDRFVELIDQSSVQMDASMRLFSLEHARADEIRNVVRNVLRARYEAMPNETRRTTIRPEVDADQRTNALLVTAAPEQIEDAARLLDELDVELGAGRHPLTMRTLEYLNPTQAADILEQIVIGEDQEVARETTIVANDQAGMLLIRANDDVNAEIDRVLKELDRDGTSSFEVRSIVLERANAVSVAQTVRSLYDDRAQLASRGRGRNAQRRVSIVGDEFSNTVLVSASDEEFAEIESLIEQFDSPLATNKLEFKVYQLEHAQATDIEQTVQGLVNDLTWNQGPIVFGQRGPTIFGGSGGRGVQGTLAIRANDRLNVLIASGEGDKFTVVDQIIETLDVPVEAGRERVVRLFRVHHIELGLLQQIVQDTFIEQSGNRRRVVDPNEIRLATDDKTRSLIVSGTAAELEEIAELVEKMDAAAAQPEQTMTVLRVENATPSDISRTLTEFLRNRAEATSRPQPSSTIVANDNSGSLIVSATDDDLAMIRDLLQRLDEPISDNRVIEIVALRKGDAEDIARIIREQFTSRGGQGLRITPDIRTNSLIINAPREIWGPAQEMIALLDSPPPSDEMVIRTYALDAAQAGDVMRLLSDTLELNASGETSGIAVSLEELDGDPVVVDAKIVADRRSNSLIVRATPESFPVVETLIEQLDAVESRSPLEWRIVKLEHSLAFDVAFTLRQFLRQFGESGQPEPKVDYNEAENQLFVAATADQFKQIQKLLDEIDLPKEQPVTKFVKLEYADAKSVRDALSAFYGPFALHAETPDQLNTRIVVNEATNSLLISAAEEEWETINRYIDQFDSQEFDPSLQLRVLPLTYADAASVAQAINDAFQGQIEGRQPQGNNNRQRQQPQQQDGERRDQQQRTVLVEAQDWVRAGAEPITNTVIVSASRQNLEKIQSIVAELDAAEYAQGPAPQLIPVTTGSPSRFAESLNAVYQASRGGRSSNGRHAVTIVPNDASSTLIVRAERKEFDQIKTLAEALQQEASTQGLGVHVLTLKDAPASRVEAAIRDAYTAKAQQTGQSLSIRSDASGNSLIIASTASLFQEIKETVSQLDDLQPAAGQGIFIIELENIDPESATSIIETIGLNAPQDPNSVSKLVTEPIRIAPLEGRNAIIVIANPVDRETILGIMKAIDVVPDPDAGQTNMRIVRLQNAEAGAVASILNEMISSDNQRSTNKLAIAVQEQIRRLKLSRNGANGENISLDLTKPIRVIVDDTMNALILGSTEENLVALEEVVKLLDSLPIGESVVVQMFPLENIRAEDFQRIIDDLISQGQELGAAPGSRVQGVPQTETGKALLGNIAMTTDARTNTIVVAGTQEVVAFVEVMKRRLDSQVAVGWVEPRIIMLEHADATDLATTIQAILIDGAGNLPQSTPLQEQVARIRTSQGEEVDSDVFVPLTRLVVRPEPQLNALVVVGTPANLKVIRELVGMLDIPAASPDATVRVYPVKHASAARLAGTIERLFTQQVQSKAIRPEDAVVVVPDERTNALVVTTSPRSFAVLESLLKTLDAEVAPDLREIRRIKIENASAVRLAGMLQQLMDARVERLRVIEPEAAELEQVVIVADERTNSLVVAAGNDSFEVVKSLAKEMDSETELAGSGVEVLTLEKANVDRIADTIEQIMERRYADMPAEVRGAQMPLVLTDPRSNSLFVAANKGDLDSIRQLVEQIESTPLNPAVAIHVVQLERKQAAQLAPRLQSIMADRLETLGDARTDADRISIQADPASNSLIIAASDEHMEVIHSTIDALATAEAQQTDGIVEIINLARMEASQMIGTINELYVQPTNQRRGVETIRVTANERLNALIVNASEEDVEQIRSLVERIDGQRAPEVFEIQTIKLAAADPLEIVGLIEEVLRGPGLAGRRNAQQATVFRLITKVAEEGGVIDDPTSMNEVEITTAIRESISLTPDRRTNSVIVSAPKESMRLIRNLIVTLDDSKSSNLNMRIFHLANADAESIAQILTDLFRTPSREVLTPRADAAILEEDLPDVPGAAPLGPPGIGATELTTIPDLRKQLSITVDNRTNSLLVAGTPRYLELVEEVVKTLDTQEGNERIQWVYQLKNAVAEDVARVVAEFVEEDQQKLLDTIGVEQLGSANRILEREVTIVGDSQSNTVLVSASPRFLEQVKNMVQQLDVDPPQVLIQVLLAEITLDSGDEWGVGAGFETRAGDVDVEGGFDLASAVLGSMGVPNLSIAGTDFNLILRALESQGRLQVLSNPSIMAANNEEAEIQVGETIRVPQSTVVSDNGSVNSQVVEEEIGIILNVIPTINPDGFVRMDINPEISSLSNRTTQISENFSSPVITVRRATTTVTVQDGQTIVLGGLISDRFELREEAIPLISDLPILGKLFRSSSEQRAKTELLIVLTPHVVESPSHVSRVQFLTDEEINRLSLPESVKEQIRRARLDSTGFIYDAEGNRLDEPLPRGSDTPDDPAMKEDDEPIRIRQLD